LGGSTATQVPLPGIDPSVWQEIFQQKSGGIMDVFFRGVETDFDGAGGELICYPKLYVPLAPEVRKK